MHGYEYICKKTWKIWYDKLMTIYYMPVEDKRI